MNNALTAYEKSPWPQPADSLKIALERAQREHDLLMNRTNMFPTYRIAPTCPLPAPLGAPLL